MQSPQFNRLNALHDKIKQLDNTNKTLPFNPFNQQNEIKSNYNQRDNKYIELEHKLNQIEIKQQKNFKLIQNDINNLLDHQQIVKKQLDKTFQRIQSSTQNLERLISIQSLQLNQDMINLKKNTIQGIDKKYKTIKTQNIIVINQQFQSQCRDSRNQLKIIIYYRQNKSIAIQQRLNYLIFNNKFWLTNYKITRICQKIKIIKKKKNYEVMGLIKNMQEKLIEQIDKQKHEMIKSRSSLENILEDICFKIEQKIFSR